MVVHYADTPKAIMNALIDSLDGEMLYRSFCVVNPKNTYEEIRVVSYEDIRKVLDSMRYDICEEE